MVNKQKRDPRDYKMAFYAMERDAHMDALACRVSDALHGATLFDAASVCSVLAAWAVRELYKDPIVRVQALDKMKELMEKVIEHED